MPLSNQEIDKLLVDPNIKAQLKMLKQSPVMFNMGFQLPGECVWTMSINALADEFKRMGSVYLGRDEIRFVSITRTRDPRSMPDVVFWIPRDSRHVVNKNYAQGAKDMLVVPEFREFSDDIKRLVDQLGPITDQNGREIKRSKRIRLFHDDHGDSSIVGVQMDFIRLIEKYFDRKNTGFRDTWGQDSVIRPCSIHLVFVHERSPRRREWSWDTQNRRANRTSDEGKLVAVRIIKYYADSAGGKSTPVPAFNDRRRN